MQRMIVRNIDFCERMLDKLYGRTGQTCIRHSGSALALHAKQRQKSRQRVPTLLSFDVILRKNYLPRKIRLSFVQKDIPVFASRVTRRSML